MNFQKRENRTKTINVQSLVVMSVLTAVTIVFSRMLSYSVWNMRIGFSFLPIAVSAIVLGPLRTTIVSGLADCIGAILFPTGAYFPGFTLTAVLVGILYGLLLYQRQTIVRILIVVSVHQLLLSLLLNTYWLSILYQTSYLALLTTRLVQSTIMIIVEIVVIIALIKTAGSFLNRQALQYIRRSETNVDNPAPDC